MQTIVQAIAGILSSMLGPSWQPRIAAIIGLIASGAIFMQKLFDGDPASAPTEAEWAAMSAAWAACIGLFTTRGNKVSSEAAGAK